jgi:hypothetical protein
MKKHTVDTTHTSSLDRSSQSPYPTRSHDSHMAPDPPESESSSKITRHLTQVERVRINTLYHFANWTVDQLATEFSCSKSTVHQWIHRENFEDMPKSGRPRETDEQKLANDISKL